MKQETISYAALSEKVGNMILFNNHSQVDSEWFNGLIEQPLMTEKLEAIEKENKQYALDAIAAATDESEKAKLQEEYNNDDESGEFRESVIDFEIYQSYAITHDGANYLFNYTNQLISYSEELELWFWHIGHYGTAWSHVHTVVTQWDSNELPEWYATTHQEMVKYTIG